jgi:hypothetical protein
MKKATVCLVIFMLTAGTAKAQEAGQKGIGLKGGLNIGFSEESDVMKKTIEDEGFGYDVKTKFGGVIGAHFFYTLIKNLSIQPELNFMIEQGLKYDITSGGSGEMTLSYSSMDFAVPLKFAFVNSSKARLGLAAGPVLSLPLSLILEAKGPGGTEKTKVETSGATFGICAGLFAGYQVSGGSVTLDVRYLMDFNSVTDGVKDEVLKRRGIFISLGYGFDW